MLPLGRFSLLGHPKSKTPLLPEVEAALASASKGSREQGNQNDDRDRYAEKEQQYRAHEGSPGLANRWQRRGCGGGHVGIGFQVLHGIPTTTAEDRAEAGKKCTGQ